MLHQSAISLMNTVHKRMDIICVRSCMYWITAYMLLHEFETCTFIELHPGDVLYYNILRAFQLNFEIKWLKFLCVASEAFLFKKMK